MGKGDIRTGDGDIGIEETFDMLWTQGLFFGSMGLDATTPSEIFGVPKELASGNARSR